MWEIVLAAPSPAVFGAATQFLLSFYGTEFPGNGATQCVEEIVSCCNALESLKHQEVTVVRNLENSIFRAKRALHLLSTQLRPVFSGLSHSDQLVALKSTDTLPVHIACSESESVTKSRIIESTFSALQMLRNAMSSSLFPEPILSGMRDLEAGCWNFLSSLPTKDDVLSMVLMGSDVQWPVILDPSNVYQLSYCLQIIDAITSSKATNEKPLAPEQSSAPHSQAADAARG